MIEGGKVDATQTVKIDVSHPLARTRRLTIDFEQNYFEIERTDGLAVRQPAAFDGPSTVLRLDFDVQASELSLTLRSMGNVTAQVGNAQEKVDRPVVYLDQLHWITLARHLYSPERIRDADRAAAAALFDMAQDRAVILPLSGAHMTETSRAGGTWRHDLAHVMLMLSRGWQVRDPITVRRGELYRLFQGLAAVPSSNKRVLEVVTLDPNALWTMGDTGPQAESADYARAEMSGLVARLSWLAAIYDVLASDEPDDQAHGMRIAAAWSESHHALALHIRDQTVPREIRRDVTRARLMSDLEFDLAVAASAAGLSVDEYKAWLGEGIERDLTSLPSIGRFREVIHERLINADDHWEANDLNDLVYLSCAAAYTDVVVGEKKSSNYLNRVATRCPPGAVTVPTLTDAVEALSRMDTEGRFADKGL